MTCLVNDVPCVRVVTGGVCGAPIVDFLSPRLLWVFHDSDPRTGPVVVAVGVRVGNDSRMYAGTGVPVAAGRNVRCRESESESESVSRITKESGM
jgi:hypothetical protein